MLILTDRYVVHDRRRRRRMGRNVKRSLVPRRHASERRMGWTGMTNEQEGKYQIRRMLVLTDRSADRNISRSRSTGVNRFVMPRRRAIERRMG